MPKLYNTVTKKYEFVNDSYVGVHPFVEAEPTPVVEKAPEPKPAKKSKKSGYKADAIDGDSDGLVQDGTVFQREVGTELSDDEIATRLESE